MIAQMLVQMPSIYKNKVDHTKHQVDGGINILLVEVLGHLRDKYIFLKNKIFFDSRTSSNTTALFAELLL